MFLGQGGGDSREGCKIKLMSELVILLSHPRLESSIVNRRMIEGVREIDGVSVRHLESLYPDYKIDVGAERAAIEKADALVFQFPFYWYSAPSHLKRWQDEVMGYGWAFGPEGDKMKGKSFFVAVTTGGPQDSYQAGGYNNFSMPELLCPYEQMANLTGMRHFSPLVVHGAPELKLANGNSREEIIERHICVYRQQIYECLKKTEGEPE